MKTRYGICTFCDAGCGLRFEVDGDTIHSVRGDPEDEFSRGHVCPKGVAQKDLHHDPDRLRQPLIRESGGWRECSFEEAYDLVARRLTDLQRDHGRDGVGFYYGNPTGHDYKAMFGVLAWARLLGSRNVFSSNSVDAHPRMLASLQLYGNQALLPVPDIGRTDYLVVMGANPVVSHGSVMTAPDTRRRLKAVRARGGRMVVIDPRYTETAAIADEHLPIRPGTDALFLLSVIHELARGDRVSPEAKEVATGVDELLEIAADYSPEATQARTGVDAADVRRLAREFAGAERAVWYGRMGTSTQAFGCVSTWLIDAINVLTGNFDHPGGAMFATPAVDLAGLTGRIRQTGDFGRWTSRVGGLPEFNGELPVAAMADEIETPGEGQVHGMLMFAGNPVLSNPNGRRVEGALQGLDFLACVDFYLNETTRLADVILPPLGPLESAHYPVLELSMGVRNVARYAPPVVQPDPARPDDFRILSELLRRLLRRRGGTHHLTAAALRGFQRFVESEGLLAALLRLGPQDLTLEGVKAAVHGVDLGPLEPRGSRVLGTRDRRVHVFPELFAADLERLRQPTPADEDHPLQLVSQRTTRSMNSWLNNSPILVKGRQRCTLKVHPEDARRADVTDATHVRVVSRVGAIEVPLEITETMMPGVVGLPFGWGHHREGTRLHVAAEHAGVSMNDITDERLFDAVCGTSVLDGVPVRVERI